MGIRISTGGRPRFCTPRRAVSTAVWPGIRPGTPRITSVRSCSACAADISGAGWAGRPISEIALACWASAAAPASRRRRESTGRERNASPSSIADPKRCIGSLASARANSTSSTGGAWRIKRVIGAGGSSTWAVRTIISLRSGESKGVTAGQHLEQDDRGAVEIGARIEVACQAPARAPCTRRFPAPCRRCCALRRRARARCRNR